MAGKISLGVIILACAFGLGWYRRESTKIEFEVINVVHELPEGHVNTRGIDPPFTVVGRNLKAETHILPGVLGQKGETVKIHQ